MYKLTFILFVIVSVSLIELQAQTFTNNGASLTISTGSSMTVKGDFENINGSIDNSGDIFITGDWTNSTLSGFLLQGTSGTVTFNGSATQHIGGTSRTSFNNLTLESNTTLSFLSSVSGELTLNGVSLVLNGNDLIMGGSGTIIGANSSDYIITNGSGRLRRYVSISNVYFPVGTVGSFLPVRLKNDGTFDEYGVRVFEDVLTFGTIGTTISEIDNCVNASWVVNELIAGGSDLTVTAYWANANEGNAFDRTKAGLGNYNSGSWVPQPAQTANGTLPHFITRSGITEHKVFAVGDVNSPMAITLNLVIDIRAFLEGPFNGTDMNPSTSSGYLPSAQPYNVAPWNYAGTENVVAVPNSNVVDWVLIELRDAASASSANAASMIAQQAGFVLNDGSVVSTDGVSNMQFNVTISQSLYVVVYHRNHLGIISASSLSQSGGVYSYDFTTGAFQAFGNNAPQKELVTGNFGMYGGDLNSNGNIGSADKNVWVTDAGKNLYSGADADLNGEINNTDKNEITIPNMGKSSYIPQ